jgi:hypothetical protein
VGGRGGGKREGGEGEERASALGQTLQPPRPALLTPGSRSLLLRFDRVQYPIRESFISLPLAVSIIRIPVSSTSFLRALELPQIFCNTFGKILEKGHIRGEDSLRG